MLPILNKLANLLKFKLTTAHLYLRGDKKEETSGLQYLDEARALAHLYTFQPTT